MCVIAINTKAQPIIPKNVFMAMAEANDDGFGLAYQKDGKVYFSKGYFNADSFYDIYKALKSESRVETIILHFRIATGSAINKEMCHPFVVSKKANKIKQLDGVADTVAFMNGILRSVPSTYEFSDTAKFIMDTIAPIYYSDNRYFVRKRNKEAINDLTEGTRWAFMDGQHVNIYGNGWSVYKGICTVSNQHWTYKLYKPQSYGYSSGYSLDDESRAKRFATNGARHKSYIDLLYEGCYGN